MRLRKLHFSFIHKPLAFLSTLMVLAILPNASLQAEGLEISDFDRVFGEESAKNVFIEYASMTCPHCASFHGDVYKTLKSEFIEAGKAKWVYRDLPWDGMAYRAALIARCLPPKRYEPMIDLIFRKQKEWSRSQQNLVDLFAVAGLSPDQAQACIDDKEMQEKILAMRSEALDSLNVSGTPTLFLNGDKINLQQPVEDILKDIRDEIIE